MEYILDFTQKLINIRELVDNTFPKISNSSDTRKYNEENIIKIPEAEITFCGNEVIIYTYTIYSFEEFCYVCFYHLNLMKKVISKCEYSKCKKYFIPLRSDGIYCPNKICQEKGPDEKYDSKVELAYKLYRNLKKRLQKRIENKDNDKNKSDYIKILTEIEEEYATLQKRYTKKEIFGEDSTFQLFLTEKDIEFQKKYPSNKREYTTNELWHSKYYGSEI